MESYLKKPVAVPFANLYLDGNNPRLAPEQPPGYADADALFDDSLQEELGSRAEEEFDLGDLEQALLTQGWMPIDNIVGWKHPDDGERWVVLEGNRRTTTLRRIRARLPREEAKLERMRGGGRSYAERELREQESLVNALKQLIADTDPLQIVPLDADTVEELTVKLPRVLAVRHITGARQWGNYAEDVWLLRRYEHLFEDRHPDARDLHWDQALVRQVGDEASLTPTATKRKLRAASSFSHFRREFEDRLPGEDEFRASDYFLFEEIVKRPFVREQFGLGEDSWHLPSDREEVLYEWVFKLERGSGNSAEDNDNIFFRHYNVALWDQMKRYDDSHGTAFAARFNVDEPEKAPLMREVEADFTSHKARRRPGDILEQLLSQLDELTAAQIANEGVFLNRMLERVDKRTQQLLAMVKAAGAE